MKLIVNSILLLLVLNSCSAQKNNTLILNYEAHTRGNSVIIRVDFKKLTFTNFEGEKVYVLSDKNWKEIQNIVEKIDLNSIKDLKAPSTKSHTDAALIASLKITKSDKVFESSTFDHGNPPTKLKELVDKLFELAQLN